MFELINQSLDGNSLEEASSLKLTRRMTIDEDDGVVEFEYELDDRKQPVVLGKGSFGIVYSAIDLVTKKKMAIKEIKEKTAG